MIKGKKTYKKVLFIQLLLWNSDLLHDVQKGIQTFYVISSVCFLWKKSTVSGKSPKIIVSDQIYV